MNAELEALVAALTSLAEREVGFDAPAEHISEVMEAICIRLDVPTGPSGPQLEHLNVLNRCARAIAKIHNPQPVARCIDLLLEAITAQLVAGVLSDATMLADRALKLAHEGEFRPLIRRALSFCALAHGAAGNSLLAIDFGLRSAAVAKDIKDRHGVSAAMANVLAYCFQAGAYEEVLSLSPHLLGRDDPESRRWSLRSLVCTNAASSALALRKYALSAKYSQAARDTCDSPSNVITMWCRMIAEFCWLRSAIGLGDRIVARERINVVNSLSPELLTTRTMLLRELANGAYESFCGHDNAAIVRLQALLDRTRVLPSIHADNLELLTEAYQRAGDHANALRYLAMRIEARGQWQAEVIRQSLDRARQEWLTKSPANTDAAALIDSIRLAGSTSATRAAKRPGRDSAADEFQSIFDNLSVSAELSEDASGHHTLRVGKLSRLLLAETGGNEAECLALERAARLHDIGKLGLPGNLLPHAGKLSDGEMHAMREHCEIGAQILAQANDESFDLAETVALSHHEHWDGGGYPNALKGHAIPVACRIVAIVETFDVLVQGREYKPAIAVESALTLIEAAAGSQFDPELVVPFVCMVQRLHAQHGETLNEFLSEAGTPSSFLEARQSMRALLAEM